MAIETPASREPVFGSIPVIVVALGGAITAVSALGLVGPEPVKEWLFSALALFVGYSDTVRQPLGGAAPYVLHVFSHGSWGHLGLNLVAYAAFGTVVARRLGSNFNGAAAFLTLFVMSSVAGAGVEAFLVGDTPVQMVGASSGISGLIAAAVYIYRGQGGRTPAPWSARYIIGIAPWVAINVLIALAGGMTLAGVGNVAWPAHLGGLAAGVVLFPLLDAWVRAQRPAR